MLADKVRETQQMTEFGRTLYSFMVIRGIETRAELLRLLNETGYEISQARLSYLLNGKRVVDPLFFACVSELLKLNKDERRKLSWAYSNGQKHYSDGEQALISKFRAVL